MARRRGRRGAFRLKITLGTRRPARNAASARLHLGDFPQAVPGCAAGPGPIQSPGFLESAAGLAGYRPHPGLYQTVRT